MSHPEFDPYDEVEPYWCPLCTAEMLPRELPLPVRNYATENQEIITDCDEVDALRRMDPPPEDIEWMEILICSGCDFMVELEGYDEAHKNYGMS